MEAEEFLKLFDSCWFERGKVFTSKQNHLPAPAANFAAKQSEESKNIINYHGLQNLQVRSLSDRCLGVKIFENSVMMQPKLQKILSGIEVVDLSRSEEETGAKSRDKKTCSKRNIKGPGRKRMMKRSLSALEFEELKGFMDLGFVFTEEDRSSANLVSIIPGLQKWGEKMEENLADHRDYSSTTSSRPYLSEAWRRNNKIKPLINWRIPSQQNEISMKDHLRNWAQTVASTVSRYNNIRWRVDDR